MEVTPSFFRVLRARAAHGRLLTDDDGQPGRQYVALLSHDFAARLPGGVTGILERELRLNDRPHTVVGVLPADFRFLNPDVRIWTPLAFSAEERAEDARYSQNHELIARLAPGATLAQAQARVDALNAINVQRAGALAPHCGTRGTTRGSCRSRRMSSAACGPACTCSGAAFCSCC